MFRFCHILILFCDETGMKKSLFPGDSRVIFHQSSNNMSHGMKFPTIGYVRPAKAQTSLRMRADLSEPLLVA